MSKEFKAGDKVYYPRKSTKVLTIGESYSSVYPIMAGEYVFSRDGKFVGDDSLPSICHATPENHKALEQLFGVEFEAPSAKPTKPTSKDIIEAKLDKSTEPVPCWVSNNPNCTQPTRKNVWAFIEDVDTDPSSKFPYLDSAEKYWMHATPFDPHTSEAITELPEGD